MPYVLCYRQADALNDLQALREQYETLTALVMRQGSWLTGPSAQLLPANEWEAHFRDYQANLARLRALGDQLRGLPRP
jgi:hypothetical protein